MGLKELKGWNKIYGMSEVLSRNIIVGFIVLESVALSYLTPAYINLSMTYNDHMQTDIDYARRDKIRTDSVARFYWKYFYQAKRDVKEAKK